MENFENLTFGIEIETVGASRLAIAEAIQSVVGGAWRSGFNGNYEVLASDGRSWKIVRDASLRNDVNRRGQDHTGEIVSPILSYGDMETLQAVVRAVRTQAKAKTNFSCGIHVHVGADALSANAICNLAKTLHKNEDLLYAALGVAPARKFQYCKPVDSDFIRRIEKSRPKTLEELKPLWYHLDYQNPSGDPARTHYHPSRYHGLNLHNIYFRRTVEFRYFDSSLHAGVVKSYIQLALSFAKNAITSSHTNSKKREYNEASGRYDFRVLMNRLGMIGPEFATARLHLLSKLKGDSAFKNGRPGN